MTLPSISLDGPDGRIVERPNYESIAERDRREALESERRRALSRLPDRFQWAAASSTVESLQERIRATGSGIAKALGYTGNAILLGPPGAGKTSLAVAMLAARIRQGDGRENFFSAFDLAEAHDAHGRAKSAGNASAIDLAIVSPNVVLDDIGIESMAWTARAIPLVLYRRHAAGLPTVVTTGLDRAQLSRMYGEGIVRRLFEGALVAALGGKVRA